jgi:tetratricopeptide (TPR) repeat protein
MALGSALMRSGQFARATEVYREALRWVGGDPADPASAERAAEIRLALARSLLTQARFADVIHLAQQVLQSGPRRLAREAELMWGTALSIEGSDLEGAAEHLKAAEEICMGKDGEQRPEESSEDLVTLSQIRFELGSVLAQQGDLRQAVALYRQSLEAASQEDTGELIERRILSYNNLAYHLLLLGDASAGEYAEAGLRLAREKGILGLQPYLLSTLGEITFARQDLDEAERYFTQGLSLAERLSMPERIAGLTANLGLVASQRGQTSLAIHRLSTALGQADSLGTLHLAAQIRLWLVPLLPPAEAHSRLGEARAIAESSGRKRLVEEADRLKTNLNLKI